MGVTSRKSLAGEPLKNKLFSSNLMVRSIVIGVVVLQVTVPGVAFFQGPPARLGWQMYSGIGKLPKIRVETVDGVLREIPFADMSAAQRPELNWREHLPAHVCGVFSDAASVDLIYPDAEQSFECDS